MALTLFCVVPVVCIGVITDKRLEKDYLSKLQASQLVFLHAVKMSIAEDLLQYGSNASLLPGFSSMFDTLLKQKCGKGPAVLYLVDSGNHVVAERSGLNGEKPVSVDVFLKRFQADHGQWSVYVSENEKIQHLLSHVPLDKNSGWRLFSAYSGELVEKERTLLARKVMVYTATAIIAVCAAAFLVYAYFISQGSMLRSFVQRFDMKKSPVPEVIPEGEFTDVCKSFRDIVQQNRECEQELLEKLTTDPLTGAFNKVIITQKLEEEVSKAVRYETPLSFVLFEVDRFPRIIDRFGAEMADQVLCRFTGILHNSLRSHDLVGRYGANQFLVILPLTDFKYGKNIADRIRSAVEVSFWGDPDLQITVSGGACWLEEKDLDVMDHLQELTRLARQKGMNRVETDLLE